MRILATLAVAAMFAVPAYAADHTVVIDNHRFSPAELTIAVGDSVTFVNQDSAPHTATASGAFDTGRLGTGDAKKLTFKSAGSFDYICTIHPSMKGSITVQ